jgi:hypothetical protein
MKRPNVKEYNLFDGMDCTRYIHAINGYCNWLEKQVDILNALEAGGVDNWEGYDDAMSAFDNE